jgi:curved DNA-binding protein CbpA
VDLYEAIGVPRDASPEEIKRAHRREAKKNHPDRGGDRARFQEIQLAYDTLKDEDRRRRYDQTGEASGATPPDPATAQLATLIDSLIDKLISDGAPIETADMRGLAVEACDEKLREIRSNKGQVERWLSSARKLSQRFKRKRRAKGADLLRPALERKQRDLQEAIKRLDEAIAIWQRARDLLESYDYKFEPPASPMARAQHGFFYVPPGTARFTFDFKP